MEGKIRWYAFNTYRGFRLLYVKIKLIGTLEHFGVLSTKISVVKTTFTITQTIKVDKISVKSLKIHSGTCTVEIATLKPKALTFYWTLAIE